VVEQGTHKPLVASSNLALGTKTYVQHPLYMVVSTQKRPPFSIYGVSKTGGLHGAQKHEDQGTITLLQMDYLPILCDSV
jgi:hypothetical protein